MTQNNLQRLNELLANKELDIPEHRRTVHESGSNFDWLKKHAGVRNTLCSELTDLLSMNFSKLIGK